jgi:class 3 adenylate cyclase/tetratricopeptide (TPR) repeat protein
MRRPDACRMSPSPLSAPSATVAPAARRHLAVLFTDLAGSTRLGRRMEPEELAALMEALRGVWQAAAQAHGGRLVRAQGDGALLLFGVEATGEDDGRRAVEAALDIQARVQALELPGLPPGERLQTHAGVHAGVLLVAPGDLARGELDLAGDVVNTAAHLAAAAPPGQVLASLAALGPYEHLFDASPPAADAAGLPAASVRLVRRRSGLRNRYESTSRRGMTPLVGRDPALQEVLGLLAGPARCVVVEGEPGIGKTRLLGEVLQRLPAGPLVLQASCEQQLASQPLQPFAQVLRAWAGQEPGAGIPPPPAEPAGPDALLAWFDALARLQPLLFVIDDWQWADDATVQLQIALLARPGGCRFLLAQRPEAGAPAPARSRTVRLEPLTTEQTRLAVRRWLPAADPFLCGQIHRHSGGIPLFVEELCHSASVGELARALEAASGPRHWIGALAVARLQRLSAPLQRIVQAAAVAGNEVPLALLQALLGEAPAPAQLQALAQADFLYPLAGHDALQFKHGITREAIYAALGLAERRRLHAAVLQALGGADGQGRPEDAEALAHHSHGAGDLAAAALHAERAGDRALAALAVDRARRHYQLALAALDRAGTDEPAARRRWCLLANKLGMCCVFDPLALQGELGPFERALDWARALGDANLEARCCYWLGYVLYALGRLRESRGHVTRALAQARASGDERLAVQVEATLGQVLAATGEATPALALIDAAVEAKRRRGGPGRGSLAIGSAYALACKGGLLADAGAFGDAHACFAEALDLLGDSAHPVGNSVRNWVAVAWNWQGCWAEALQVAGDSEAIAQGTRALLLLAAARGNLGYAAWQLGDAAGAGRMEEAMRWMDAHGSRFYVSLYHGWLAALRAGEGDAAAARAHGLQVLRRSRQAEPQGHAVACRAMAWLAARAGDAAGAARWLARADVQALRRGSAREQALNALARSQVAARFGGRDGRALDQALGGFERLGMAWHLARAQAWQAHDGAVPPTLA